MDNLDLELERVILPKGGKDHSQLQNLDYANSGHKGFASTEQLNATNEKVSTLEEQVQTNASAIQALSEGIDPEKIDGIKDLINYVEEHEVDVVSIQEGIEQNANDIDTLEEKVTALEEKPSTPSGEPLLATFNIASANTEVAVKNLTGATMVDWGDGSPIEDISSVTSYSHTYNTITTRTATFYGVKNIGNNAFQNQPLIRIALPNRITGISSNAFSGTQITNISIPNLTTSIMNNAFYNCASLVSVVVGASVSYIAASVFALCNKLEIVQFLGTPAEIAGSSIFPTTTKIIVPYNHLEAYKTASGWTTYADQLDSYALASELPEEGGSATPSGDPLVATYKIDSANTSVTVKNLTGATSVDWGDGSPIEDISSVTTYTHTYAQAGTFNARFYGNIKVVGEKAFYNQRALYRIVLPDTITSLGVSVFETCRGLVYAKLPIGLGSIPNRAFDACSAILEIKMPLRVNAIGTRAFGSLNGGICLKIVASGNITWGSYPFDGADLVLELNAYPYPIPDTMGITSGTKIIVPNQYLDKYKTTAGWSKYASQIDAYAMASDIGNINTQLANIIEGEGV